MLNGLQELIRSCRIPHKYPRKSSFIYTYLSNLWIQGNTGDKGHVGYNAALWEKWAGEAGVVPPPAPSCSEDRCVSFLALVCAIKPITPRLFMDEWDKLILSTSRQGEEDKEKKWHLSKLWQLSLWQVPKISPCPPKYGQATDSTLS